MTAQEKRIELEGGGHAIAVTDDNGNVEISEYDAEGNAVQRTYGYLPVSVEQAHELPIPDGLTPEEEHEWLDERGVAWPVAISVVVNRHPDEWPPEGVDFAHATGSPIRRASRSSATWGRAASGTSRRTSA